MLATADSEKGEVVAEQKMYHRIHIKTSSIVPGLGSEFYFLCEDFYPSDVFSKLRKGTELTKALPGMSGKNPATLLWGRVESVDVLVTPSRVTYTADKAGEKIAWELDPDAEIFLPKRNVFERKGGLQDGLYQPRSANTYPVSDLQTLEAIKANPSAEKFYRMDGQYHSLGERVILLGEDQLK